jgi:hypothetical protein
MRNKVFGWIGVLWGSAIIISTLAKGIPSPSSSYGAGGFTAFGFGFALLAFGIWTLWRERVARA